MKPAPPTLYRIFGRDGEYDRAAMKELIRRGEVTSLTDVTLSGTDDWKTARMFPELQRYLALASGSRVAPSTEAAPGKGSGIRHLVVAVALTAAGLFFGFSGAVDLFRGFSSNGWPQATDAEIISADLVRRPRYRSSYRRRQQRLTVTYRYRANGRLYLGDRVSFGREWLASGSRQLAEARRDFRVYHHPTMHRMSVIRRGPTLGAGFAAVLGFAAIAAGVVALLRPEWLNGAKLGTIGSLLRAIRRTAGRTRS